MSKVQSRHLSSLGGVGLRWCVRIASGGLEGLCVGVG